MTPLDTNTVPLAGAALVEASAGTGKTHTIGTLYVRMIVEARLHVDQILVVTFTKAATAELRDRLRTRLRHAIELVETGEADGECIDAIPFLRTARDTAREATLNHLHAALHGFDEAAIFTIHGFCQRVLREYAFESGAAFDVELTPDPSNLLDTAVNDFWVSRLHDANASLVEHLHERLGVGTLRALVERRLSHPNLRLVPEESPAAEPWEPLLAAAAAARSRVAALWSNERHTILERLQDEALHQRQYAPKKVAQWAVELDAALAVDRPGAAGRCPAISEKLTTAHIAAGTKKNQTPPAHPFFDACAALAAAEAALTENCERAACALQHEAVVSIPAALREQKRRANVLSFDDLLNDLAAALAGPTGDDLVRSVRQRFAAALIDEFQDTDPTQYDIFRRLFIATGAPVFFVGDPKQAIYSFRGADVFTYMRARRSDAMRLFTLGVNWRSDPRLLAALNAFFASSPDPFRADGIRFRPVQPRPNASDRLLPLEEPALQFLIVDSAVADADAAPNAMSKGDVGPIVTRGTAAEIRALIDSETARIVDGEGTRRVRPADVAVLCRTNREVLLVQRQLRRLGVPSVSQSAESVFGSHAAAELERIVRAMLAPHDVRALNAALATSLLGMDAENLDRLHADEHAWDVWGGRFADLHELWLRDGFMVAFPSLLETCGVLPRVLAFPDGERLLTDVLHVAELIHKAEAQERLRPHGVLRWLARMRADSGARQRLLGEDAYIRLESDAAAVQLVTIHKSKGLEYPIVFCPFLWSDAAAKGKRLPQCHDPASDDLLVDLRDRNADSTIRERMDGELRAEQLRLLYVALTRAIHRCYVVWGAIRGAEGSPLGHFLGNPNVAPPGLTSTEETATQAGEAQPRGVDPIDQLAAASGHAIGWRPLATDPKPATPQHAEAPAIVLQCPEAQRGPLAASVVSSFTSLLAFGVATGGDVDAADRDAGTRGPDEPAASVQPESGQPVRLGDFASGRQAGELFHQILEEIDFQATAADALHDTVAKALTRHRLDVIRWTAPLSEALLRILQTPLPHDRGALRLADVTPRDRIAELEFAFPVTRSGVSREAGAAALTAAFTAHAPNAAVRTWAASLRARRIAPPPGHLKGYVDLVFRDGDGRYFVADYKSNHLGAFATDYAPERLAAELARHDYYLQYHLYTVALIRHLRMRLRDFDYERDFGGVFYLFVRGMDPEHPAGTGVFFDRPTAALITSLDRAFSGERA